MGRSRGSGFRNIGCAVIALAAIALAQTVPQQPSPDFVCPMHRDVRSATPGTCPRCGMRLVGAIPDVNPYPLSLALTPRAPKPGERVVLSFKIRDPKTATPVTRFEMVHERLFHMFIVSQDLEFLIHEHPALLPDGTFQYECHLPKRGMYRVLADYYPSGGTPQLTASTIFVPGGVLQTAHLDPDLAARQAANLEVELVSDPPRPIAGLPTLLFFRVQPAAGLEPYLGAWGHLLAASDDLIDMIHTHPFLADGGPRIQFNMIFPRARPYRLWVQFQRMGVVNTAMFTVPVSALR